MKGLLSLIKGFFSSLGLISFSLCGTHVLLSLLGSGRSGEVLVFDSPPMLNFLGSEFTSVLVSVVVDVLRTGLRTRGTSVSGMFRPGTWGLNWWWGEGADYLKMFCEEGGGWIGNISAIFTFPSPMRAPKQIFVSEKLFDFKFKPTLTTSPSHLNLLNLLTWFDRIYLVFFYNFKNSILGPFMFAYGGMNPS